MPSFKHILFDGRDGVSTLTINRPDKLNALNNATLKEIREAIQGVLDDRNIKALIITGSGEKAFVAGADIGELSELNELNGRKFSENGQDIFELIENFHKPVIAAINGFALGGGFELALACHIRIASKNARFGLPEVTLGILPGFGGTQRLTHLIGKGRSLEMMLTGEMIDAETGYNYGIINHLVDTPDLLLPAAQDILKKILRNAPLALGMVIESVNAANRFEINGYQTESNCFSNALKTNDFNEGIRAFLEKRPPEFTGD
ncbi:MAG: enoyl-CoA hydratase/isomerase family protein [Cyclobacteriaceae bacterium]|nr:enoyl-CoA hydratase/isomerase family protein [Cyclobacteriaceae bacterium]